VKLGAWVEKIKEPAQLISFTENSRPVGPFQAKSDRSTKIRRGAATKGLKREDLRN